MLVEQAAAPWPSCRRCSCRRRRRASAPGARARYGSRGGIRRARRVPVKPHALELVEGRVHGREAGAASTISRHFGAEALAVQKELRIAAAAGEVTDEMQTVHFFIPPKCEGEARGSSLAFHPRLAAHNSALQSRSIRAKPPKCSVLLVRLFNQRLTNSHRSICERSRFCLEVSAIAILRTILRPRFPPACGAISPLTHSQTNAIISECGNGHDWLAK